MYSASFSFAGQASAYRFVALMNPANSGKNIIFEEASVLAYASVSVISNTALSLYRITSATGGSVQSDSIVNKFQTAYPNPTMELRTANPTVVTGARLFAFAPPVQGLTVGALSPSPQTVMFNHVELVLAQGEGVAFLQEAAGLTGHQYNIYSRWTEQPT